MSHLRRASAYLFRSLPCLLAGALFLAATPAAAQDLKAVETFDAAWSIVDKQHFDPAHNGVDWDAVGEELRPRAAEAESVDELRQVITEMLGRLGQSHFSLMPKEILGTGAGGSAASPPGTCGLDLRFIDGEPIITRAPRGDPAALAGVKPGWKLVSIEEKNVEKILAELPEEGTLRRETAAWRVVTRAIDGDIGTSVELVFEDEEGATREVELERIERDAIPFEMPGLPTFFLELRRRVVRHDGLRVGVIHFSNWFRPLVKDLDRFLVDLRSCDGIVIDLRGNTGGEAAIARSLASHFFTEPTSLGTQKMRNGNQEYSVQPRQRYGSWKVGPYEGPLAILTDETSGSCSEVFTGGMQALGRARVFGSRSAGSALPATMTKLPNDDYLLHAIADFLTVNGDSMEGDGVEPDEAVTLTRADVIAGTDRALEAAVSWIASL
jgi:carboxyl-terminal processing protease